MLVVEPLASGIAAVAATAIFTAPNDPFKTFGLTKLNIVNTTVGALTITLRLTLGGVTTVYDVLSLAAGSRKTYNFDEVSAIWLEANDSLLLSDGAGAANYQLWGGVAQ